MTKSAQTLFFVLTLSALFHLSSRISIAQTAFGLTAIPPRLELTVKPGKTVTQTIKIRNESPDERVINTTTKDIIVTDDKGTPIIVEDPTLSNRWAASSWLSISPSQFKLKPGETKMLTVIVMAPDDALPGGHYAMINHSPTGQTMLSQTGSAINVNVGTLLYITVPGDIHEEARVDQFNFPFFSETGPINFKTIITNLSDIHISPLGSVSITNWLGQRTNLMLDNANIFPGTHREFNSTLSKRWLFGRYQAQLSATYGTSGQALLATGYFWVIPVRLIVLVILTIVIAIALFYLIGKKNTQLPPPEPESSELGQLKKKLKD